MRSARGKARCDAGRPRTPALWSLRCPVPRSLQTWSSDPFLAHAPSNPARVTARASGRPAGQPCAMNSGTGFGAPGASKRHGPVWPPQRRPNSTALVAAEHARSGKFARLRHEASVRKPGGGGGGSRSFSELATSLSRSRLRPRACGLCSTAARVVALSVALRRGWFRCRQDADIMGDGQVIGICYEQSPLSFQRRRSRRSHQETGPVGRPSV